MLTPLNNNCLIEIIDEYDGILRNSDEESVQKGVLRAYGLTSDHLTASTGYEISDVKVYAQELEKKIGKTVYWQEYADAGSKFTIDGKRYVLISFYRLTGFEG